jgi:hypothetical protein
VAAVVAAAADGNISLLAQLDFSKKRSEADLTGDPLDPLLQPNWRRTVFLKMYIPQKQALLYGTGRAVNKKGGYHAV